METLNSCKYGTDKSSQSLADYDECFRALRSKDIRLLELGVHKGSSLMMWRDYFEKGTIVGVDCKRCQIEDPTGRIRIYAGGQEDLALLDRVAHETAPEGFDIIIDDCSHIGELTEISFWHLFEHHLKPGGIYSIEDWGTGYWNRWWDGKRFTSKGPRGKWLESSLGSATKNIHKRWLSYLNFIIGKKRFRSHDYGMVGFIKTLIDECGRADITKPNYGTPPQQPSKFKKMQISPGKVIIVKA